MFTCAPSFPHRKIVRFDQRPVTTKLQPIPAPVSFLPHALRVLARLNYKYTFRARTTPSIRQPLARTHSTSLLGFGGRDFISRNFLSVGQPNGDVARKRCIPTWRDLPHAIMRDSERP